MADSYISQRADYEYDISFILLNITLFYLFLYIFQYAQFWDNKYYNILLI